MRLIDAERLKEVLEKNFGDIGGAAVLSQLIDNQQTAFDVDKVVEQLEGLKDTEQDDSVAEVISTMIWNKSISKAIDIVKGGGRDD